MGSVGRGGIDGILVPDQRDLDLGVDPPGVSFTIGRIGEGEILSGTAVTSAELIQTLSETGEDVIAADGTVGDVSEEPQATL